MLRYVTQLVPILGAALLTLSLSSCASWQVADLAPQQLLTQEEPHRVRVTGQDGAALILQNPRIVGDSIVGVHRAVTPQGVTVDRNVAFPLTQVREIAVRRTDAAKTVVLMLNLLVLTAIYVYVSALSST